MSDFDRNVAARGGFAGRAVAVDAGLRAYMIRVYNYMAAAVALTGVVAWLTFNAAVVTDAAGRSRPDPVRPGHLRRPPMIVLMLAHARAGVLHQLPHRPPAVHHGAGAVHASTRRCSASRSSSDLLAYTGASITRVFFISAASFGALEPVWLHHAARSVGDRLVPDHGPVRHHHREPGQHLPRQPALDFAISVIGVWCSPA